MIRRTVFLCSAIFCSSVVYSQTPDTTSWLNPVKNRDKELSYEQYLPEINIKASDADFKRKYSRYLNIVLRVYPFVTSAVELLEKYDEEQAAADNETREWKKFRNKEMDRLRDEFGEGIRNMTHTQGDVLVKLLYRETGMTAYQIINKYMGGVKALMWQTVSLAGGADLKQTYNPVTGDDHVIEIVMQEIYAGKYGKLARPYIPPSKKELKKQKKEYEKIKKKSPW